MVMATGGVLWENVILDKGVTQSINLTDYKIPSTLDMPRREDNFVTMVDVWEPEGPYGAKGAGELAMTALQPAIANAVYEAIGVRIKELPFSKVKVLEQIRKQKR